MGRPCVAQTAASAKGSVLEGPEADVVLQNDIHAEQEIDALGEGGNEQGESHSKLTQDQLARDKVRIGRSRGAGDIDKGQGGPCHRGVTMTRDPGGRDQSHFGARVDQGYDGDGAE